MLFDETKNSADFHLEEEEEDPLIFFEVDEETGDMKDEGFKEAQNRPTSSHGGIPPQDVHEIVPNIPYVVPIDGVDADNPQGVKKLPKWYIKTIEDSSTLEQAESNNDGLRRSQRIKDKGMSHVNFALMAKAFSNDEPTSFSDAIKNSKWKEAKEEEYSSIMKNNTWTLVELPHGKQAIGTKWVYMIKYKADGTLDKYKARLVVKGYVQQEGIDF